jgi:hypothetical protein
MIRIQMRALGTAAVVAATVVAACSETPTTPPVRADGSAVIGQVQIQPEAVVLAEGGTQQLSVAVTSLDGTPITAYDAVQYTALDSSKVTVSATGLATARTGLRAITDAPIGVMATVTKDGITRTDTAYFAVVATAGSAPTFSMADVSAGDKVPVATTKSVTPTIIYFNGTSLDTLDGSAVPVKIHIHQPTLARRASPSSFSPIAAQGTITVSATTVVFGTPLTDSVTYTLGDPLSAFVRLYQAGFKLLQGYATSPAGFAPSTVFYLQAGGELDLQNWAKTGTHTVGLTCTATDGGVAPPPVTGMAASYGSGFMIFTTPGRYSCDWTSDGFPDFPTDGSLHFFVVVR